MEENEEITWIGIMFLLLKFVGLIALVVIPVYVIYKILKWMFE